MVARVFKPEFLLVFIVLLTALTAKEGPDQRHYARWAKAAAAANIDQLESGAGLSPKGVPFAHWSAGPGLFVAPLLAVLQPLGLEKAASFVAGLVAVAFFWFCLFVGLEKISDRNLALLGCIVGYVATPLGYYSLAVSSETYSLLPAGLLFWQTAKLLRGERGSAVAVAAATGMLLMFRPYLAAYAWPALLLVMMQESRRGIVRGLGCGLVLLLAIALAIGQVGLVHYWMTGNLLQSPYAFGDEHFSSFDRACPFLMNVLFDTFHGLLPTHPLMGVGLMALAACVLAMFVLKHFAAAAAALLAALAIAVNVYVQGSFYCWWMAENSFGMRGLVLAGIPAVAAIVWLMHGRPLAFRIPACGAIALCTLWSWLMFSQGPMNYVQWSALLRGQTMELLYWLTPLRIGFLAISGVIALVCLRPLDHIEKLVIGIAATLTTALLLNRIDIVQPDFVFGLVVAAIAFVAFIVLTQQRIERWLPWKSVALFLLMLAGFVRLALPTQRRLANVPTSQATTFNETQVFAVHYTCLCLPSMQQHGRNLEGFLQRRHKDWVPPTTEQAERGLASEWITNRARD